MSEPFIGEIRSVGFNFAPLGWAKCEGQFLSINQNQNLYALLRTMYGGDGRVNFQLPDLRGRCLIGAGEGWGLTSRVQGKKSGHEQNILYNENLPVHNHTFDGARVKLNANLDAADLCDPTDAVFAKANTEGVHSVDVKFYTKDTTSIVKMSEDGGTVEGTISNTGGSHAFDNMMPYLAISYIISLDGIYPSRS